VALDLASFRVLYPEMDRVADTLAQAKLDEAEGRIDPDYFGAGAVDQAHGLLSAHLIAISPAGRQARLVPEKAQGNSTTYYREYEAMLREFNPGPVVL
jgi:hypothetical protein